MSDLGYAAEGGLARVMWVVCVLFVIVLNLCILRRERVRDFAFVSVPSFELSQQLLNDIFKRIHLVGNINIVNERKGQTRCPETHSCPLLIILIT
jgi:hypothetical protein